MIKGKKGQYAMVFLLLFLVSLLFYAVMFPEIISLINESKATISDTTIILIYDLLPFGLGFMLIIGLILSIAAIINR
jgi:hypothetical protein|tara:strand:+ start:4834 stop:5064 length:231 start_codon:yes stop_codon:yes gene_type:complete